MPTELTPTLPPTARPSAGWGRRHLPSAGGAANAIVAVLVALAATGVLLGPAQYTGQAVVVTVVVLVFALAQVFGELVLVLSAPGSVRRAVAGVVGATGGAVALAFAVQGHAFSSTCTDYCSTDVATGRRIEAIALGVAAHGVLTMVRLVRRNGRSRRLEVAVGVLAPVLVVSYVVLALLFGSH